MKNSVCGRGRRNRTCVRAKFEVAGAANDILVDRVVKMAVKDFLRKSERAVEAGIRVRRKNRWNKSSDLPLADDGKVVLDALVVDVCALFEERHGNFLVADAGGSGGHTFGGTLESANRSGGSVGKVEHRTDDDDDEERV